MAPTIVASTEQVRAGHVAVGLDREESVVERPLGEQRRDDAERRADQHEHDRDGECRLVRREELGDAPQQVRDLRRVGVLGPLRRLVGRGDARAPLAVPAGLPARRATAPVHAHALQPKRRVRRRSAGGGRPRSRPRAAVALSAVFLDVPRDQAASRLAGTVTDATSSSRGCRSSPWSTTPVCHVIVNPSGPSSSSGQVVVEPRTLHRVPTERRIRHLDGARRQCTDRGRHAIGHGDGEPTQQRAEADSAPASRPPAGCGPRSRAPPRPGRSSARHPTGRSPSAATAPRSPSATSVTIRATGLEAVLERRPVLEVDRLSQPFADPRGRSPPRALGDRPHPMPRRGAGPDGSRNGSEVATRTCRNPPRICSSNHWSSWASNRPRADGVRSLATRESTTISRTSSKSRQ